MPPLSSQQKISPFSSLPVPKKPAAFIDPLTRPEIGPMAPVVKITEPLMPPLQKKTERSPAISGAVPVVPAPRTGTVPGAMPRISTERVSENKPVPLSSKPPIIPITNTPAAEKPKRKLPDEIKDILEMTSRDFAAYAKNGKTTPPSLGKTVKQEMDEWDRAILLGEYSQTQIAQQKIQKLFSVSASSPIPKKTDAYHTSAVFPSRVMEDRTHSPVSAQPKPAEKPTTVKPVAAIPVIKIPTIPQKPKNPETDPVTVPASTNSVPSLPSLKVPAKPKTPNPTEKASALPIPNMSGKLVEKIIEGQMRNVFENAPPLIQKSFEKMAVRDILQAAAPGGNIENDVWRKRVREYIEKLRVQARSAFPGANTTDPREGELFLDYIGRIYPIILKTELIQEKTRSV